MYINDNLNSIPEALISISFLQVLSLIGLVILGSLYYRKSMNSQSNYIQMRSDNTKNLLWGTVTSKIFVAVIGFLIIILIWILVFLVFELFTARRILDEMSH